MKLRTAKAILLFSISLLLSVSSFGEDREYIFTLEDFNTAPLALLFKGLTVPQTYGKKSINLNPLAYLDDSGLDGNPIADKKAETESVYIGIRHLPTQIPIQIFEDGAFKKANIQSDLFDDVSFTSCTVDHCMADQITLLGNAHYEMVYKFLSGSELSQIQIPESLLSKEKQKNIKFALVQNAYNWNDFFTSGFNLILVMEDTKKNAEIMAFQAFLLSPHFIPDDIFKWKISGTLNSQIDSFNNALKKYKQAWKKSQEGRK